MDFVERDYTTAEVLFDPVVVPEFVTTEIPHYQHFNIALSASISSSFE